MRDYILRILVYIILFILHQNNVYKFINGRIIDIAINSSVNGSFQVHIFIELLDYLTPRKIKLYQTVSDSIIFRSIKFQLYLVISFNSTTLFSLSFHSFRDRDTS